VTADSGVTADLIDRARGGDGDAFRELIAPYEDELRLHCYRILLVLTLAASQPGTQAGQAGSWISAMTRFRPLRVPADV
jgi:hypothetical protein